jgi:hypothetical protein
MSTTVTTSFTVTRDDVDLEYTVTAEYTPGTENYFDRTWGNWLPGDPHEIDDVVLVPDGHSTPLEYGDLLDHERDRLDETIIEAARDEGDER